MQPALEHVVRPLPQDRQRTPQTPNPNLHDIANMSFRVELWDRHANHVRWVVAAAGSVTVAHAAFEACVQDWPHEHFTLRQGIMLIREHPKQPRA